MGLMQSTLQSSLRTKDTHAQGEKKSESCILVTGLPSRAAHTSESSWRESQAPPPTQTSEFSAFPNSSLQSAACVNREPSLERILCDCLQQICFSEYFDNTVSMDRSKTCHLRTNSPFISNVEIKAPVAI